MVIFLTPLASNFEALHVNVMFAKGSLGHAFTVCIRTGNQNQVSFSPFGLQEISVLFELTIGHLRYRLTGMPPQPNSPPDYVFRLDQSDIKPNLKSRTR